MPFPKDFLWGCATSAGQIEGGAFDDGRTASIWDTFAARPGKTYMNQTPTVACDSYHKFERDLADLKYLGVNAYRMSISWSRVLPNGTGKLNTAGTDYYKRCFERLLENHITPFVTLYHWDLPQILEDKGGWANRDCIEWFGEYADKMFRTYADTVPFWATVNEPIATYVGYALGAFAPGHTDEALGNQARHNILVAHGKGVEAFRSENIRNADIGVVIDIWKRHALTDSPDDIALMNDQDERNWKFYVDPILTGHYSDYLLEHLAKEGTLMRIEPDDYRLMSQKLDYFGLNVYNRVVVTADEKARADFTQGGNFMNNASEYYPKAIYDAIHLLKDRYKVNCPIYITENGTYSNGDEPVTSDGTVHDDDRIRYINGFLTWLEKAIDEGCDVRGYFLWSLLDNFEWSAAYHSKFGLMKTDFETGKTTAKQSALFYKRFIEQARR